MRGADAKPVGRSAEKALLAALAVAAACATALLAGYLGDYELEAGPSLQALARGDLAGFTHASAVYAGSFTLRSPFVALAGLLDGRPADDLPPRQPPLPARRSRARAGRLPAGRRARPSPARALGRRRADRRRPAALEIMHMGHPEEVLVSALAVGAVLWAPARPVAAGALLGLAVGSKTWALIAVGPVLLAAGGRRPQLLGAAALAALAVLAPFLVGGPEQLLELTRTLDRDRAACGRRSSCCGRSAPLADCSPALPAPADRAR